MNNTIKNLFGGIKQLNKKSQYINKILKEHAELSLELSNYMILHPEYESITKLIYCICNNIVLPKCKICNKQLTYSEYKKHKNAICSKKCNDLNIQRKPLIFNYLKTFKH